MPRFITKCGQILRFFTLVVALLHLPSSAEFRETSSMELPSENSLKDALRHVLKIPDEEPPKSLTKNSQQSLKFMLELYHKISSGQSDFPEGTNTVRSITPMEKEDTRSSFLTSGYDQKHSLSYNLTKEGHERVLMSYLHLTGHRKPNRPCRLLFYDDFPSNGPSRTDNNKEDQNRPVMVSSVHKLPLDIDISKLTKKMIESRAFPVLRVKEQQLRRGKWVTSPSEHLSRKIPLLLIVSADSQLVDLETFEKNRPIVTNGNIQNSRSRRSALYLSELNSNLYESSHKYSKERIQKSIPKDKYRIQKQSTMKPMKESKQSVIVVSQNRLNEEDSKLHRMEYFTDRSTIANSAIYEFQPIEKAINEKKENFTKEKITIPSRFGSKKKEKKNVTDKEEAMIKNNNISFINSNDVNGENDRLLLPLKAYRSKPKNKRTKKRKKMKHLGHLSSSNYWNNRRISKLKKKNKKHRKGKNTNRKNKRKRLPNQFLHASISRFENDGTETNNANPGLLCHKEELFVDFKLIGLDKIIVAPKGFHTYFCSGHCPAPLNSANAGSNHALIQSLLRMTKTSPNIPDSCCVPAALESISMLYINHEGVIVLKTFPNMVVKSCSCQ